MSKTIVAAVLLLLSALPSEARAHCDTLDGPVVQTARKALDTGKLNPVLAWVRPQDEAEIKAAFTRTLAVRKSGPEARALADTWFFETVVRVHRAGEGAPYTGLKPAGSVTDPALAAADRAVDTGKLDPVARLLEEKVRTGLTERFSRLRALKPPADDVAKGRAWVAAYVAYVHFVSGIAGGAGEPVEHGAGHPAEHAAE